MPEPVLLSMRGISKAFPGVRALSDVDFTLRAGEIHALMGENGAGKSTLIKVLTGVYPRDGGETLLEGRPISPSAPLEAQAQGISTVYQEVNLIPALSVAENIYLGRQPRRHAWFLPLLLAVLAAAFLHIAACEWVRHERLAITGPLLRASAGALNYLERVVEQHTLFSRGTLSLRAANGASAALGWCFGMILPVLLLGGVVVRWLTAGRRQGSRIDWPAIHRGAEHALERLEVSIDVSRPLNSYSIAIQQMVAIARALDVDAKVLILDEPTSSLDTNEVKRLFDLMRRLKAQGLGIIFVTHFMDQVYEVSDRITVLRNGRLVGEYETARLPRIELIARMMGKEIAEVDALSHQHARVAAGEKKRPFLHAEGMGRSGSIQPFDLEIAPGEVVGLAGLLGSGRTEIARLLFAIDQADSGTLTIQGKPVKLHNPRQAIALGLGFCPEDRKIGGIIPDLSIRENIVLVLQGRRGWLRPLSRGEQNEIADRFILAMNIATPDAEKPIKYLSGGNQQKAILARWLASRPDLLILDEPTRGIDVGAKFEIARLIESLREEGMAILFISSELEEVVRSCQRVVVLRDRRKIAELSGDQISEPAIMSTIAGA